MDSFVTVLLVCIFGILNLEANGKPHLTAAYVSESKLFACNFEENFI